MKKMFITGNVGQDPVTRYDAQGAMFVTFTVGVSVGTKVNPKTDWVSVSANGKSAEILSQYVKKGNKIFLEGFPSVRGYLDKEGKPAASLNLNIHNFEFLSSRERSDEMPHSASTSNNDYQVEPDYEHASVTPQPTTNFNAPGPSLQSDDIPF